LLAAGFVVVLLPAVGFPRTWPVVPILWGGVALAFGIDAVLSPRRENLTLDVRAPEMLYIGERDRLGLTVRTLAKRSLSMRATVDLSDELEPQPEARGRASGGEVELDWDLVPSRRGTVEIEKIWLTYAGPLGLWAWSVVREIAIEIPVLPNLRLVRSAAIRFFSDRSFRTGLKIERYKGDGTEFESLKDFLIGDDSRAIDWKASARHRRLLCRQYRAERNHQIILAVDTGHLMCEPLGGIPKLDHGLNAALLLAYVCLTSGDRVGLFTFDARVGPRAAPMGGVRSMSALTHMTSAIEYTHEETNFTLGLTTLSQDLRKRSLVVLLTDFVDTVTAELMVENVDRMRRRHVVVFVSLRDPLLTRLTAATPSGAGALNRAVVAQSFLRDREVVHRRLARMGIFVLDVEPHRIGPALINQYLDVKRRELV
jgi:uncharacterized protein (DUF58 family)